MYLIREVRKLAKKFQVELNEKTCKACGICVALCPRAVLGRRHDGKAEVVREEDCIGCQTCSVHCPDFCFVVKEAAADEQ